MFKTIFGHGSKGRQTRHEATAGENDDREGLRLTDGQTHTSVVW